MNPTIPNQKQPISLLKNGPNSGRFSTASTLHPLSSVHSDTSFNPHKIASVYGSGLAMRLVEERRFAANATARLPGLDAIPTSEVMLDTVKGQTPTGHVAASLCHTDVAKQNSGDGLTSCAAHPHGKQHHPSRQ